MKRLFLLLFIASVLFYNCSSRNVKLDPKYLSGKSKSVVLCKSQAPMGVYSEGDGLIAAVASSRFSDFMPILEKIDLKDKVKIKFMELLSEKRKNFEVVNDTNIIAKTKGTTNYKALLTDDGISYVFEIKILKCGIKTVSGALGLLTNYYAYLKAVGTLRNLNEQGKVIWLYEYDDTTDISGTKSALLENDGKKIKDAFDEAYKKMVEEMIENL